MDELFLAGVGHIHGTNELPIPQDRDLVAHAEDFFQPVGDVDHGDAVRLQFGEHPEQDVDLCVGQRRGGLVQDEQLALFQKGLGDLHQLAVGHRDILDLGLTVDVDAHVRKDRTAALKHGLGVDQGTAADLLADKQVFPDGQLRHQIELLIHHADSRCLGLNGGQAGVGLAAGDDAAALRCDSAGENFAQGGFARAVFSDQGVDLPFPKIDADMIQHGNGAIALGQALR